MATPLSMIFDIIATDRASAVFTRVGESAVLAGEESERGMARVSGAVAGFSKNLSLAFAAAGVISVKMAADFQTSTNLLVTSAGESRAALDLDREGLLQMAGQVGVSATKLSEALYTINSAGIHGSAGLGVLKAAAEGAAAEGANLETVSNGITTALNAYKLPAADATAVTNEFVRIVSLGKVRMEDLSGSISAVLPVAAAAHISFAEIGGAMATMTAQGTSADQAATYLRQTIGKLMDQSPQQRNEMKLLGLSGQDLALHLGDRGLSGTIDVVYDAIRKHLGPDGMSVVTDAMNKSKGDVNGFQDALTALPPATQTAVGAVATVFGGVKTMMGVLELGGQHLQDFKGNVQAVGDASRGAGKDVSGWDVVQGSFNQQLKEAKAGVGAFAIEVGTKALPVLTDILGYLNEHKQVLPDLAYALGTVLVAATAAWTLSLLANPVVLFAAGVAGLGAAAVKAYQDFKPFRDTVDGFGKSVKTAFGDAAKDVSSFWDALTGKQPPKPELPAGTNKSLDAKLTGPTPIVAPTAATTAGAALRDMFTKDVIPALEKFWTVLHDQVAPAVGRFIGSVRDLVETYGPPLLTFIKGQMLPAFHDFADYLTKSVWPSVKALADVFGPILLPAIGLVVAILAGGLSVQFHAAATIMNDVVGPALKLLAAVFIQLGITIGQAIDGILVTVKALGDGMLSGVSTILRALSFIDPGLKGSADKVDGWKNSFDGSMRAAIDSTNTFVDSANASLDQLLHPRTIQIDAKLAAEVAGSSSLAGKFSSLNKAAGGAIYGPGTGTSDSVPVWLSHGEHVWTALEVQKAGGHGAMEEMRRAIRGYATGGPVLAVDYPNPRPWAQTLSDDADTAARALLPQILPQMLAAQAATVAASYGGIASPPGGAVERWRPIVDQALTMLGQALSLDNGVLSLIRSESGGNPNAINLTDSNARAGHPSRGLMQTIPSTFEAYRSRALPDNIVDPLANVYAGIHYALVNYGPGMLAAGGRHGAGGGYIGYELGTDYVPRTGPAVLHEGEAVLTKAQNASRHAGGLPEIRVFIGDRELTDIVRVEVVDGMARQDRRNARGVRAGG